MGLGSYWVPSGYYFKEINLLRHRKPCFAKTPNAIRKAATKSCASLRNSLHLTAIQDKIHRDFPEKTWLTAPLFTNSVQQLSYFFFFLFHHKLRSSQIQPSQTRLPTSPPKQQTNRRQSRYTTLPIFRNFTKINSCYRSNCLTCFCMQKEPDLVPLQWGRAALLVPVSDLTFFPARKMI